MAHHHVDAALPIVLSNVLCGHDLYILHSAFLCALSWVNRFFCRYYATTSCFSISCTSAFLQFTALHLLPPYQAAQQLGCIDDWPPVSIDTTLCPYTWFDLNLQSRLSSRLPDQKSYHR